MGYLYYGNYALYYEVGRAEAIRELGFTYRELEEKGIMMHFNTRDHRFSSSSLRKEVADKENDKNII